MTKLSEYYDMEITLLGIEPRIWRRFLILPDCTFENLHYAIQASCGWEDSHLYEFLNGKGVKVSPPQFTMQRGLKRIARSEHADAFDEDDNVPVAGDIELQQYFSEQGDKCFYIYDFGDYWEHLVELKGIVELPEKFVRQLTDGARAFPPEDCGGTFGYEECCEASKTSTEELAKLNEEEKEELEWRKEWLGDWEPGQFDLQAAKKEFDR